MRSDCGQNLCTTNEPLGHRLVINDVLSKAHRPSFVGLSPCPFSIATSAITFPQGDGCSSRVRRARRHCSIERVGSYLLLQSFPPSPALFLLQYSRLLSRGSLQILLSQLSFQDLPIGALRQLVDEIYALRFFVAGDALGAEFYELLFRCAGVRA